MTFHDTIIVLLCTWDAVFLENGSIFRSYGWLLETQLTIAIEFQHS
jgi:hypothetical protein